MSARFAAAFRQGRVLLSTAHACVGSLVVLSALFIAAQFGAVPVTFADWWTPLRAEGIDDRITGSAYVLWQIRIPRVVFALLIGATLGLCGALTQGLFRNPLADPSLLGVTSGAACATALTIVVFSEMRLPILQSWGVWVLPVAAFSGALLVCGILDRMACWITPGSIAGLLLTGIALNAITAAVIGLCTYVATDEQLRSLSFWTLGSLAAADSKLSAVLGALLAVACWGVPRLAKMINALSLGDAVAAQIGVDVPRVRAHIILLVAILSGFAVAWCGVIGFIGLIAPHVVRALAGPDQRQVMPLSMLAGGLLLLLADTLARTLAIPAEIPVGIFTALLGGPFFLLSLCSNARGRIG